MIQMENESVLAEFSSFCRVSPNDWGRLHKRIYLRFLYVTSVLWVVYRAILDESLVKLL